MAALHVAPEPEPETEPEPVYATGGGTRAVVLYDYVVRLFLTSPIYYILIF